MKAGGGRAKGASAEREVIKLLEPIVKELSEGALFRNLEQVRSGGHDIVGIDWLAIEVKRCEVLAIETWWKQCVEQAERKSRENEREGKGKALPVLIYRQNRKPWLVVLNGAVCGFRRAGDGLYPARVTIALSDFLGWFRYELQSRKEILVKNE